MSDLFTVPGLMHEGFPRIAWLPDETLFSWICRFHHLACHSKAETTMQVLFGARRSRCLHDFPSRLDELVSRTGGSLGEADALIRNRTIVSLFLPFRSVTNCSHIRHALRSGSHTQVKFAAGVTTSSFRGRHPLKACPECIHSDAECFGTSYWHLHHQLPAAWICPEHGSRLVVINEVADRPGQQPLALPHQVTLISPTSQWRETEIGLANEALLGKLARMSWQLHLEADARFSDVYRLSAAYREALIRMSLIDSGGRIRWASLLAHFRAHVAPLTTLDEFAMLRMTDQGLRGFLARVVYEPRSCTHPLRHLIMCGWLFQSWQAFRQAYDDASMSPPLAELAVRSAQPASYAQTRQPEGMAMLCHGLAPSAVARALGVDVVTACAWAASLGIRVRRRPKTLHGIKLQCAIEQLTRGEDKEIVASNAGVSVHTITRLLRTEPDLQETWHLVRFRARQDAARQRWENLLENVPDVGVLLHRLMEPAAYAWLYRNDHAWLIEHTRMAGGKTNHATARWGQRDEALANAIQRAAAWLAERPATRPLSIDDICRQVPELQVRLKQLKHLPRSQRAIHAALTTSTRTEGDLFSDPSVAKDGSNNRE